MSGLWSRTPKVLFIAGLCAIAFAVFAARPSSVIGNAAVASQDFYPGPCSTSPANVVVHFKGGISGCTDTNGKACSPGEVIEFTATSSNYNFAVCDSFTWSFGDGVVMTTLWPSVTRQFTGNNARTVRLSVGNSFGSTKAASVDVPPPVATTCAVSATQLCFVSNRYAVTLDAVDNPTRTNKGATGDANVQTADTGFFTLFGLTNNRDNPEVVVKVLDFGGQPLAFFGALTDTEVFVNVQDTTTGTVYKMHKNAGNAAGGFALGNSGQQPNETCPSGATVPESTTQETPGACVTSTNNLCLNGSRFRVSITATDPTNVQKAGLTHPRNDVFGYFDFSPITNNTNNLEAFAKVVPFGTSSLIFYGGLTDLEYRIKFTDTTTGRSKTYAKAKGSACGGFDAF